MTIGMIGPATDLAVVGDWPVVGPSGQLYRTDGSGRWCADLAPAGQWGKMDILCDHRHVKVTLNDHEIVDANLDDHPEHYKGHPGIRPEATTGHIGLQYHTGTLDFRNLRIRVLH